jgi:regulatory protein YycI of two-component signal transduction system YycFG
MNVAMFIVGVLIFSIFLVSIVWEVKTEKKASNENYEHYGGEGCNEPHKL